MNEVISLKSSLDEEKLRKYLIDRLFEVKGGDISTIYKSSNVNITVYKSGKLLVQGKESSKWFEEIKKVLSYSDEVIDGIDPRIGRTFPRIGSDESGKGDFFGPLVTVAFYLDSEDQVKELEKLGVKDSKKLSDSRVITLASDIQRIGLFDKIMISPSKYNDLYKKIGNLNSLLAWSHAKAIENIVQKKPAKMLVIDKFADEQLISEAVKKSNVELVLMTNAEREIVVAAASILARNIYIGWLNSYKDKTGVELPKGAGDEVINTAVQIAKKNGLEYLSELAKLHFNTYNVVKSKLSGL